MDGSERQEAGGRHRGGGAAGPRRVCILAVETPYVHHQGSSTYLDHLVRSLRLTGAELHLRVLQRPRRDQLRLVLEPGFLDPYRSVALRSGLRRGAAFYARDPRNWLARLGTPDRPPTGGPWSLARPEPGAAAWAAGQVARLAPDWVIAHYFNAAEVFDRLPAGPSKAILLHDVFALRAESLAALGRAPDFDTGMIARETTAFRAADAVLAIKAEEAAHVARVAPGTATVPLPHAVDIPEGDLAAPRPPVAVFVGSVNRPNVDALAWLLAEIWPAVRRRHPDARLRVIGRVAASHEGPWPAGAEPVGFVADLATEYAAAAAVLAPIRFGSGVKIKLVEGLAHGLPGIATPVGAEGLAALPSRVLRIAGSAEGFAAAVAEVLANPDPAGTRAEARAAAATSYARDAVARRLATELDRIRRTVPA
jgi:glycosyltransferase involved in cell wall biosynthesis